MELTKLIEQWCGDDQDSARGFIELFNYDKKQAKSWTRFVEFLASRPTCGEEQRRFLDEIEKYIFNHLICGYVADQGDSMLFQSEFESSIEKVINGE